MDITIFSYQEKEVRTITDENGDPWWVAKDACDVLELSDVSMSLNGLEDDEKLIQTLLVSGQNRSVWTINEPGLYSLVIRSNKPEAKKFKRWITHEVLPAIRKTGIYSAQHKIPQTLAQALQLAADQARQIEEQRPKVEFVDDYVDAQGLKTLTETAKTLEYKRKDLIEILERDGYLFRRQGRLEPYATAVSRGLFAMKTGEANNRVYYQVYITPRGIEHIAETYRSELAA
ncbi:MAG: BRO family protein [Desulfobacteraceae bacterium]|jgi:anti-repressor protein